MTAELQVIERQEKRSQALAAPASATNPMQMIAIAVQQGADIAKLEKLMDLQERWEKNNARKAFDAAIAEAKAEIKPIVKAQEVDFTSTKGRTHYRYEGFADIALQVDPILARHGLSYRHRSVQEGKKLKIVCILSHRDGHSEETELSAYDDESGNKNSIQAVGSTATYLQRYTLKLALGLSAAKDDDGNRRGEDHSEANKPAGYDGWLADMQAKADEGQESLRKAWEASASALRVYASAAGELRKLKARAAEVRHDG